MLRNVIKNKDIRNSILFTLLMLLVVRIGSYIPVPGVNVMYIRQFFGRQRDGIWNFIDMFTGGSFSQMSLFALGITPYITASIVIQLLTIAIPALEELQKDGESGRKKIASITRYGTLLLALMESFAMSYGFGKRGIFLRWEAGTVLIAAFTFTAGSMLLMWIGERITEHGVGNGISIVLLINILSRVPNDLVSLFKQFIGGKNLAIGIFRGAVILLIILGIIVFVVLLQGGERRIQIQYSQKVMGRKRIGGQNNMLPVKINTAGVIPVIFASSIMQMPILIAQMLGKGNGTGPGSFILKAMYSGNWCNPQQPWYTAGMVFYIILTIFFAYFYTSITFNPLEISNNLRKSGGVIPGIRPGKMTAEYLKGILNYTIFIGVCGLIIVQVVPFFFNGVFKAQVSFGGTSLIIIVGVTLETIKQIESRCLNWKWKNRGYRGFGMNS